MTCLTCPARGITNIPDESQNFGCGKLNTYDWLDKIPDNGHPGNLVEVKFKNTRKEFFRNANNIKIHRGDYVAVETERGHDIGQVSLTGRMAELQFKKKTIKKMPLRNIYRRANKTDMEKWHKARLKEKSLLMKSRQIALKIGLEMKISDVECQGDGSKATFYYIADKRVDFRELVKRYANEFNIRIDMRQIGARQEAAMVGGIGSCGKELCCSSWRTNLDTVLTQAAHIQELPHNIQKLTGQCGKLKCCLMYELDSYLEAQKDFPDILLELETDKGIAVPVKKDILKKTIVYSISEKGINKLYEISLDKVKEIIMLNKKGIKAGNLKTVEKTA